MNVTRYDYREHGYFQSEEEFFNSIVAGFTSVCEENRARNYEGQARSFAVECATYFIEVDQNEFQSFYNIDQYNRFVEYVTDGFGCEGHVVNDL